MIPIAAFVSLILAAIALLHAYWAAGGLWPGTTPAELSDIVVGLPGRRRMPSPKLSALVTAMIAAAAAWPLLLAPLAAAYIAPGLAVAGSAALALVFLMRGVAGLTPIMARHSAQPFARYNRTFYSPLCLVLGAGFLIQAFNGGTP